MSDNPSSMPKNGPQNEGPAVAAAKICVLIVDDTPIICHLAEEILRDAGYEAHSLEDGYAALEFARGRGAPIDILVTDLTMPTMDGRTLIREFRQLSPKTSTILMTGYLDDGEVPGSDPAGQPDMVITKPFRPPELLKAVGALRALR